MLGKSSTILAFSTREQISSTIEQLLQLRDETKQRILKFFMWFRHIVYFFVFPNVYHAFCEK